MKPLTKFVCRISGAGFSDISGKAVERPIVYLVPADFFRESISGKLASGISTHSFHDWNGPMYAVNATGHGNMYRLTTGNPVTYATNK